MLRCLFQSKSDADALCGAMSSRPKKTKKSRKVRGLPNSPQSESVAQMAVPAP